MLELPELYKEIHWYWRQRRTWQKAEMRLTQQCVGACVPYVKGDTHEKRFEAAAKLLNAIIVDPRICLKAWLVCGPLIQARDTLAPNHGESEKALSALGKQLPIFQTAWAKTQIKGVSYMSMASLVGECGDSIHPGNFRSYQGLWMHFGCGQIDGQHQCLKNFKEDPRNGYKPYRHGLIKNIGDRLINKGKNQGKGPRLEPGESIEHLEPYQQLFYENLRGERIKNPILARPQNGKELSEKGKESFSVRAHNRAARKTQQQFLRHLRSEWKRIEGRETSSRAHQTTIAPFPDSLTT
jgi:hypothetical protein